MNYYQILGVSPDASDKMIRQAFRLRAKRIHPDVNPDDSAKQTFQRVNEAYQVLKDAQRRRLYDIRLKNGTLNRKIYYRPAQTRRPKHPYYNKYKNYRDIGFDPSEGKFEKIFDQILFFTLFALGLGILFVGLYRAFGEQVEGVNPVLGIVFGVVFTGLLVFAWDKRQRLKTGR